MSVAIFGPMKTGLDLETEAKTAIKRWMNTYLHEIERKSNLAATSLPRPRSYIVMNEFDTWPEDQLPCVLLISTGILDTPTKRGGGEVNAKWGLGVAVVALGQSRTNARRNAQLYTAAIRNLMIQKMTETGFANSCEWLGDAYDDIHSEESRNLAAGRSMFRIAIDEVANRWKGPKTPDPEPYPVYTAGQTPFNDGAPSTMNTIDRQETLT